MKRLDKSAGITALSVLMLGVATLCAQQPNLTRAQWLKKVGASVKDQAVLEETVARVAPEERVEFASKVVRAATRLPAEPTEKGAALVKTAVALIGGSSGELKQQIIAEVFGGMPIDYLPLISEELAKRFDQEFNQLSNEQFEKIASDTLAAAVKRNAEADVPSVRNTFVILAFLRGAKDPALQNKLITQLPDERQRNLAAAWIPPALNNRNYDSMLAASDVAPVTLRENLLLGLVGHSSLDRLLADLTANQSLRAVTVEGVEGEAVLSESVWLPLSDLRATGGIIGDALTRGEIDHMPGYGINRVPRPSLTQICCPCPTGYQNQAVTIISGPQPVRR